jgi:hypothetical protein
MGYDEKRKSPLYAGFLLMDAVGIEPTTFPSRQERDGTH